MTSNVLASTPISSLVFTPVRLVRSPSAMAREVRTSEESGLMMMRAIRYPTRMTASIASEYRMT
jgi:hypothetical protein